MCLVCLSVFGGRESILHHFWYVSHGFVDVRRERSPCPPPAISAMIARRRIARAFFEQVFCGNKSNGGGRACYGHKSRDVSIASCNFLERNWHSYNKCAVFKSIVFFKSSSCSLPFLLYYPLVWRTAKKWGQSQSDSFFSFSFLLFCAIL